MLQPLGVNLEMLMEPFFGVGMTINLIGQKEKAIFHLTIFGAPC
jgi:hypothetical protein